MKAKMLQNFGRIILFNLLAAAIISFKANAATYVIQFGGALGFVYQPNFLMVNINDTIKWEGDFGMHPLSSISVPMGAQTFHQASGNTFSYIVMVAGAYTYQCDVHVSLGMVGGFLAQLPTSVSSNKAPALPHSFILKQNYPNPFNPSTNISFDIPHRTFVTLKIYNALGNEVATVVNEYLSEGSYTKSWNASNLASGTYFYRLKADGFTETKKLILIK